MMWNVTRFERVAYILSLGKKPNQGLLYFSVSILIKKSLYFKVCFDVWCCGTSHASKGLRRICLRNFKIYELHIILYDEEYIACKPGVKHVVKLRTFSA